VSSIPSEYVGWWRITETSGWSQEALDVLGPAMISFGTGKGDRLRMIAILAYVSARFVRNGVSFSWEGCSEYDPISGTGRARLGTDGKLGGTIRIRDGDEATLIAEKTSGPLSQSHVHPIRVISGGGGDR